MKDMNWPERVAYLENQLADSDRDNQRLREFIEGLPDGDEIVRLRGLLTRIHGIAAEPRPVNMAVRLENIACIASGERDATSAQLAEEQRFLHGAAADAQQVPEGMALYKGEFVTARMVVERLAEAESAYLSAWARLVKEERLHGYAMEERDHAEEMADKLADAIATLLGVDIGEHSNMNCPWEQALEAFEERAASTVTQDAAP
jgi:hypothetical protein